MTVTSKVPIVSVLALLIAAPAVAGQLPVTDGDYYAPTNTVVQQPTPAQTQQAEEGDFYAPSPTIVQQPTAHELKKARQGDFYAPISGH